jgi:Leishmanolysin
MCEQVAVLYSRGAHLEKTNEIMRRATMLWSFRDSSGCAHNFFFFFETDFCNDTTKNIQNQNNNMIARRCVLLNLFLALVTGIYISNRGVLAGENTTINGKRSLQRIGTINRIDIINVITGKKIMPLTDGMIIDLKKEGLTDASQLNFIFVTSGNVKSISFQVSGNSSFVRRHSERPFLLCGNATRQSMYSCTKLNQGKVTIAAQPFSRRWGLGVRGRMKTIEFAIDTIVPKGIPIPSPTTVPVPTIPTTKIPTSSPIFTPTSVPTQSPISIPTRYPTNAPTIDRSKTFDITMSFTSTGNISFTPDDVKIFQKATKRWSDLIVSDLPDVSSVGYGLPQGCTAPLVFDDLHICAETKYIDDNSGILGWAGLKYVRGGTLMPLAGVIGFDASDMPGMRKSNQLYGVVLHEIGHILGIGTLWTLKNIAGQDTENCPYKGQFGNQAYQAISGCKSTVPTEQEGGPGTRCGHFSDTCFRDEVMTGYRSGNMPISRLTLAALQDIGFNVSYAKADAYSTSDLDPSCVCKKRERSLRDGDVKSLDKDIGKSNGTFRRLSDHGYKTALKFGKTKLMQQRIKPQVILTSKATPEVIDVSSEFISVIYDDGINGIHSILVSKDDL